MGSNVKNISKSAFRSHITRAQSQFKRFKRRFNASKNPVEKRFLKTEAGQVCKELKQFSKQWKNCGFGACTWITRSFSTSSFGSTAGGKTGARRYGRKSYAKRSYGRRSYRGRTSARRYARNRTRRSYIAW